MKEFVKRLPVIKQLFQIRDTLDDIAAHIRSSETKINSLLVQVGNAALDSRLAAMLSEQKYSDKRRLNRHEFQVFSQNGEDGVLAEILRRIGVISQTFVEIGVGDGLENNTSYLLWQGWRGFWIDGGVESARLVRANLRKQLAAGDLVFAEQFVTAESIGELFKALGIPFEFDVLSLDIDRNTYWVWKALAQYKPRVAVIEYNASIPPPVEWVVPYVADATWQGTMFFGASLKSLEHLGSSLSYNLVACDLSGTNAFFVRSDLCQDHFLEPYDAETHYEPPRHYLGVRHIGHPRSHGDR